jgi:hypothetical protein
MGRPSEPVLETVTVILPGASTMPAISRREAVLAPAEDAKIVRAVTAANSEVIRKDELLLVVFGW